MILGVRSTNRINRSVEWAVGIANDDSHGYDQENRQGPNYDCSSLIISAWKHAGVPLTCTYTGNMRADMLSNGFQLVTDGTLQKGDVLLNDINHTAMMIDNLRLVQASSNEFGGIVGGKTGDQTGGEIAIRPYYDYPWDCVLRYTADDENATEAETSPATDGKYTVRVGDTLWSIAERFLGDGFRFWDLVEWNGLKDTLIHPGDVLSVTYPESRSEVEGNAPENAASAGSNDGDSIDATDAPTEYTVKYGDTLWSIAEKILGDGLRWADIADYNGITGSKVNMIMVGQKLRIPKK